MSQGFEEQFFKVQIKIFPSLSRESFLSDNRAHLFTQSIPRPLWWIKPLSIAGGTFSFQTHLLYPAAIQSGSPGLCLIYTLLYEDEPLTHLKCFLFYVFNQ